MTNLKLLILLANLLLVRLALAKTGTESEQSTKSASNDHQDGSAIALEQINSLDYAPGGALSSPVATEPARSELPQPTERRRRKGKAGRPPAHVGQLILSLLGQLEKTDFKRLLNDAMASAPEKPQPVMSSRSGSWNTTADQQRNRSGVLAAETGNLLSITKQLVKLARSQVVGGEFGAPLGSWLAPLAVPSMLSAASHAIHDSHDFTAASLKSDWFWVVVPAVIVVGAGIIVLPLVAAWLVSHMMNQNTFTVSAGRRRRKRDLMSNPAGVHSNGYSSSIHSDLFKLLDVHRLLDHEFEPQLLVNKLSNLYSALNSFQSLYGAPNMADRSKQ